MTANETAHTENTNGVAIARLVVGLAQGVALYLLYTAQDHKTWPATDGLSFSPLLCVAFYGPLLFQVGVGSLKRTTLALWLAIAIAVVAGLGWYGIWSDMLPHPGLLAITLQPRIEPSFALFFFLSAGLFIAHALIAGGDADGRFIANYSTHFDLAWKFGLQWLLAIAFVGIFWGLLELGAALFDLIGITFFSKLIEHPWFAIPATTLALAAAVHLTDVRAGLVRGTRTLVLVLLSWLLPMMTIIAGGFLATLVFTGLDPLWKTHFAAGYLLTAAGALVFLINAAYQDGDAERRPPAVLQYAGTLAAFLLLPLVAISAYALMLRVRQYGWTTERVESVACLIVAASYGVGYALAALPFGPWLARIARWNFFTALLVLAVLFAVFSPIADPTRIAVASQVARLEAGKIKPEVFDFAYLRWNSGRFGIEALERLAAQTSGPNAAAIRSHATTALKMKTQYGILTAPTDVSANLTVYPRGRSLPPSFLKQDWSNANGSLPPCLKTSNYKCDVYVLDLAGDGKQEVAIVSAGANGAYFYLNGLFAQRPDGVWKLVGRPDPFWSCKAEAAALQAGKFDTVVPAPKRWKDIEVAGQRLTIHEDPDTDEFHCPK
jgi:Domain of unknown function (DUF4153)